jgi:hypothetical protein
VESVLGERRRRIDAIIARHQWRSHCKAESSVILRNTDRAENYRQCEAPEKDLYTAHGKSLRFSQTIDRTMPPLIRRAAPFSEEVEMI